MKVFEFDGEKYKTANVPQREWGEALIALLETKGNEDILDLGCGDGALTECLAERVPQGRVLGIDASHGMLEAAQEHRRSNLRFELMNINDMSFCNQFDIIFSNAALHWVKNHSLLLESSYKALRPSGIILWSFGGNGNCVHFYSVVKAVMQMERYKKYFKDFEWPWYMPGPAEYTELVNRFNFSRITISEVNADRYFESETAILRWLDQPAIVPFLSCIPDDADKRAFRDETAECLIRKTKQKDGTCFETFRRIQVYAVK